MNEYKIKILEKHLDTFGHMNNATYLEIFEEARWELITQNGWGLERVQKEKIGPVILAINIQFLKEITLRETIAIHTAIKDYSKKIGVITQKILKENGELACEADFTFSLFDLKSRKILEPTPEWNKALGLDP